MKEIKELKTDSITINCGEALLIYLKKKKMNIADMSGIPGSQNCIYLPDKTSFNWKSADAEVRINCKENAKRIIETNTNLKMFDNGKGDSTRDYSLLVNNQNDLDSVLVALKMIDNNSI